MSVHKSPKTWKSFLSLGQKTQQKEKPVRFDGAAYTMYLKIENG